jgi:hypothetical protein
VRRRPAGCGASATPFHAGLCCGYYSLRSSRCLRPMGSSTPLTVAQVRNVRRQPVDILEVVAVDPPAIQRVAGRSMFRSPEAARLWSTLLRAARRRGRGTELFACRARPLVDNEASRRLATIPGVGPITASAIVATITDPFQFHSARHLAAWIGLVPRQHSSGGKQRQRGDFQTGRSLPAPITPAGCDRGDPAFVKQIHSRGWLAQEPARTPARTARLGGTG